MNLTLVQSAVCALLYTAADFPGVLQAVQGFSASEWMGLLYLGLVCSVFAFLVQTWAIQQTSGSRASLLMGTEPIWAVLIGVTIGQDSLAPLAFIGAGLIIVGTYLGLRAEARHRAAGRRQPRGRGDHHPGQRCESAPNACARVSSTSSMQRRRAGEKS